MGARPFGKNQSQGRSNCFQEGRSSTVSTETVQQTISANADLVAGVQLSHRKDSHGAIQQYAKKHGIERNLIGHIHQRVEAKQAKAELATKTSQESGLATTAIQEQIIEAVWAGADAPKLHTWQSRRKPSRKPSTKPSRKSLTRTLARSHDPAQADAPTCCVAQDGGSHRSSTAPPKLHAASASLHRNIEALASRIANLKRPSVTMQVTSPRLPQRSLSWVAKGIASDGAATTIDTATSAGRANTDRDRPRQSALPIRNRPMLAALHPD